MLRLRLPGNSLRGSAAQGAARRLCRSQHVYDGRAVCFCVTRQSHVTSLHLYDSRSVVFRMKSSG